MEQNMIYGRNSVLEGLRSKNITINFVYIQKESKKQMVGNIIKLAKDKHIPIKEVPRNKMEQLLGNVNHQGIAAEVSPYEYVEIDDIIKYANEKGEKPFILVLDGIQDPHNLGSMIRSAECSGVHGIVISKRHSVQVTPTVVKVSTGATAYVKIARVGNINQTIKELKDKGFWIYGAEANGETDFSDENYDTSVAMVIGAEGKGLSRLTSELCDIRLNIPMKGKVNSLNASVAAAILMFKVLEKRMMKK